MNKHVARIIRCLACAVFCIGITGCEFDSSDTATRNVDLNVYGVYAGTDEYFGDFLVNNCTGSKPEYMDVRQTGDEIEAISNHGILFKGTIGSVTKGETCTFTLEGKSTVGNRVIINGHFTISGSTAIMEGTWIEDSLYAVFYGEGSAPNQPTNTTTLAISPTSATVSKGSSKTFSATGGTAPYSWALSSTNGSISPTNGPSTVYTANTTNGTVTLTLRDSSGTQKTAEITNSN